MDRFFLEVDVQRDQHRVLRRGHHHLVGAHGGLGEVLQRSGLVVPFNEVAHQRGRILHAVGPLDAGPALGRVHAVAREHQDGRAIDPGVVDGHRRVLQADAGMAKHRHGLARRFSVAVRHRDRGFLVHAGEEFGLFVAAVVDDRLVQAAEAGSRVGGDVVDADRLDHVNHEVRTRPGDERVAPHVGLAFGLRGLGFRSLGDLRRGGHRGGGRGARCGCAF